MQYVSRIIAHWILNRGEIEYIKKIKWREKEGEEQSVQDAISLLPVTLL